MEQSGEHFGQGQTIAGTGFEQARRTVNREGKTVIGVALDIGHKAKEFHVSKQQLIFPWVVAVSRDGHVAGTIEDALSLRQVVTVDERFGSRRVKLGQNVVVGQVCIHARANLFRRHVAFEFA